MLSTPTKMKRASGGVGLLSGFAGGPPSPYTTRTQSMPVVPTSAQPYPPAQRTPPASHVPVIAPMYGTVPSQPQQAPSSVRRVQPPNYRSHSYDLGHADDAAQQPQMWSEELRPGAVDASDVEKGESPYALAIRTGASPADRDAPSGSNPATAAPLQTRGPRAAPTSSAAPPTPTRAGSHQHSFSRTQQPSPPTSTAGSSNMYSSNTYAQASGSPGHSSSSDSSPPFKYDQQHHAQGQLHRVPSKQLLNPGKTRTPDRSLPFKEEADNDEHEHHHPEQQQRQSHRLSGTWDAYDPEQGYAHPHQAEQLQTPYGGLADDTAVDDDHVQPLAHQPASRSNLAEMKNMAHHLQEPHESSAHSRGQESSQSSGTPRSPTNGLPPHAHMQGFAPNMNMHGLPPHVLQMMAHMPAGVMSGESVMSTTSSAWPMGHVAYDITTSQFDPDVFQQTTVAQLREQPQGANGKRGKAGGQAQQYPVYANPDSIAAHLALQASSPVYAQHHQHQQQYHAAAHGQNGHPARPDAPEPATPQAQTPFSPPPRGTPYPYTYGMMSSLEGQLAFMHASGLAPPSDSAFSPAATPFPGGAYYPFLPPHLRAQAASGNMTARSSPSHFPLEIAGPHVGRRLGGVLGKKAKGKKRNWQSIVSVPARGESTAPPETEYSGDEFTEAQTEVHDDEGGEDDTLEEDEYRKGHGAGEEEWFDVDDSADEDDGGDLLELEFHPRYVASGERRKRKFDKKWDKLVKAFQDVDRTTDATMVLMAAPSHAPDQLLALSSRGIKRLAYIPSAAAPSAHTHINTMRASFARLASHRRATRSALGSSLADRLADSVGASADGAGEEGLRRALDAALGSLSALGTLYEKREERWREEMRRQSEDSQAVQRLLVQTLGAAEGGA